MSELQQLVERGGVTVVAIMILAVVLYSRCFTVLLGLRRAVVLPAGGAAAGWSKTLLQQRQEEIRDRFRQDRMTLGAMIAAAPLLGLLGTVSGMVKTFESLSSRAGDKSMEGLAGGIAEVLVATESGLAVAIPAMILVYAAHRQVVKRLYDLNEMEAGGQTGGAA